MKDENTINELDLECWVYKNVVTVSRKKKNLCLYVALNYTEKINSHSNLSRTALAIHIDIKHAEVCVFRVAQT